MDFLSSWSNLLMKSSPPNKILPKPVGELASSDLGVRGAGEFGFVAQEIVVAIEEVDSLRRLGGLVNRFSSSWPKGLRVDEMLSMLSWRWWEYLCTVDRNKSGQLRGFPDKIARHIYARFRRR